MLYTLDANYKTLTEVQTAELAPQVALPANTLTKGMVLRGRLSGKIGKAEGPASARFQVAISPPAWGSRHAYKVGDRVTHDRLKTYVCTTAGISDLEGFLDQGNRLLAYWPLNEQTGIAYDHSDNETNLTDVAYGTRYVPGSRGARCMDFDGSTGYASGLIAALGADWSYSLWVNPDTLPASGLTSMIFTIGARVELYLTNPAGVPTLTAAWRDSGTTARTLAYIVTLSTGVDYHIVVTHHGKTTTMYINGAVVATDSTYDSYDEPATDIYLGRDTTATGYYDGKIGEVRLYSRALSAAEVSYLYRLPAGSTTINTRTELGPTGLGTEIVDGEARWEYAGEAPVILDSYDVALGEAEHNDVFWSLVFEAHVRESRDLGVSFHDWRVTVVAMGKIESPVLPAPVLLPVVWPHAAIVAAGQDNVLHVLYTPEQETMSIACMTYALEAL